jgi:hypothetical protein
VKSLHLCVENINFATLVWKQAQIAERPVGLADTLFNDRESKVDYVSPGLLDIRNVA